MSRSDRRRRGFRGRAVVGAPVAPFFSRYVRRHLHRVADVEWTIRSAFPRRRERKMQARMMRAFTQRGMSPKSA